MHINILSVTKCLSTVDKHINHTQCNIKDLSFFPYPGNKCINSLKTFRVRLSVFIRSK